MEKAKKKMSEEAAFARLSQLCAQSEHCVSDMRRKMDAWELPDGAEERIISRLLAEKFIDEARYARAYVADKFRDNKWGKQRIVRGLRLKGISQEVAERAAAGIDGEASENTLEQLLRNKLKTVKGKSDYEVFMKLLRFSVGRGFSPDEAHRSLTKILKNPPEDIDFLN